MATVPLLTSAGARQTLPCTLIIDTVHECTLYPDLRLLSTHCMHPSNSTQLLAPVGPLPLSTKKFPVAGLLPDSLFPPCAPALPTHTLPHVHVSCAVASNGGCKQYKYTYYNKKKAAAAAGTSSCMRISHACMKTAGSANEQVRPTLQCLAACTLPHPPPDMSLAMMNGHVPVIRHGAPPSGHQNELL